MDTNERITVNIGFIGAGNMAKAIGEGLIDAGKLIKFTKHRLDFTH